MVAGSAIVFRSAFCEDRYVSTGQLVTSSLGFGLTLGGGLWMISVTQKQLHVSGSYTPTRANQLIEAYNGRLRKELDLSEEDVKEIDLSARASAPRRPRRSTP